MRAQAAAVERQVRARVRAEGALGRHVRRHGRAQPRERAEKHVVLEARAALALGAVQQPPDARAVRPGVAGLLVPVQPQVDVDLCKSLLFMFSGGDYKMAF